MHTATHSPRGCTVCSARSSAASWRGVLVPGLWNLLWKAETDKNTSFSVWNSLQKWSYVVLRTSTCVREESVGVWELNHVGCHLSLPRPLLSPRKVSSAWQGREVPGVCLLLPLYACRSPFLNTEKDRHCSLPGQQVQSCLGLGDINSFLCVPGGFVRHQALWSHL